MLRVNRSCFHSARSNTEVSNSWIRPTDSFSLVQGMIFNTKIKKTQMQFLHLSTRCCHSKYVRKPRWNRAGRGRQRHVAVPFWSSARWRCVSVTNDNPFTRCSTDRILTENKFIIVKDLNYNWMFDLVLVILRWSVRMVERGSTCVFKDRHHLLINWDNPECVVFSLLFWVYYFYVKQSI